MKTLHALLHTDGSWTRFLQRIVLAFVIFPHGAQKLFGWFGGYGYHATLDAMRSSLGVPKAFVVLVILAESLGSLGLFFGAFARVAAFGISAVMLGAILLVNRHVGFFMNWTQAQAGEGIEFHLLALALSIPLLVWGAGRHSIDGALWRRVAAGRSDRGARDRDVEPGASVVGRQVTEGS